MDDDKPSINGWSPPLIRTDWGEGMRLATQADIDALIADREMLHRIVGTVRREFRDAMAQRGFPPDEKF